MRTLYSSDITRISMILFVGIALMCLLEPGLWGQKSSPLALAQTFENAQAAYRARLEATNLFMRRLYIERLKTLQVEAAELGGYETAQAYLKESERIRIQLGPAMTHPLTLTLYPEEAATEGALSLGGDPTLSLSGWDGKTKATWKLPTIPHGGYEVHVTHRGTGIATLSGPHYFISGELRPEKTESKLGNLRITHDSPTLTLSLFLDSPQSKLEIHQIVLISHAP
ncbi:MAG: hypothetical protein ACI8T1_000532 [Verrucomicrobiales bacterium]|jgi:hypothetical protein